MYQLVESKTDENHHAVLVTDERFKNVVYQYNWVRIPDNVEDLSDNDDVELSFHYEVLDNPEGHDVECNEFETLVGDILTELLQYHINTTETESESE